MASLGDIKKRIRSVKNSQKMTGAMKLVAAAKLRRAQESILQARPYAEHIGTLLRRVATRVEDGGDQAPHPLLDVRAPRRALLVVLTSDRGLCGPFNAAILRKAEAFIAENSARFDVLEVATIGRKGRDYFRKRKVATVRNFPGVFDDLTYRRATEIAEGIAEEYRKSELDAVYVLYSQFGSAISQVPRMDKLLPVVKEELPAGEDLDYIYELGQEALLEKLLPRYLATQVWRAMLESTASEHGARMTAMDAATKNAKELNEALTLQYNRARQAAITRELMDIVGGAEALAG